MNTKIPRLVAFALALVACGAATKAPAPLPDTGAAVRSITAADLLHDIETLSSPRFEGRAPGTSGEELAVGYIAERFRGAGLAPGNPDGTFLQTVPLVGVTSRSSLTLEAPARQMALRPGEDCSFWSYGPAPKVHVEASDMVFVGYGVVAPEYGWDDFKGVDVRGKTIVFLIGDPPVPDPAEPTRLDPKTFRGNAMTYYGRWTYKFEIAAKKGAAAALIVHETGPAGYGWPVVGSGAGRERFEIEGAGGHAPAEGWIHLDRAKEIFRAAGKDFETSKARALDRDFRPEPLDARASFDVESTFRPVRSKNVVARVVGSDPTVRDELVVYSAHWDHLGRDRSRGDDRIFAGALDNASGVAWLLEIAQAYGKLSRPPRRSVLFLAATAEEYGILGSRYYAEHPLYPLGKTLADINMDVMNPWGRTKDVVSLGRGQTTMDETLARAADAQGRRVTGDPESEKGYYYRSDHFEFARHGVPALGFLFPGSDYVNQPADFGQKKREDYVARAYHTPLDIVQADWDLEGAVEDTKLLFDVGLRIAEDDVRPTWVPNGEFRRR